ncbi:MAG: hypothetical protein NVSMB63_16850 [Sediminibacterium sp.]
MKYSFAFILSCILTACSSPVYKNPHIIIKTEAGDIEIELYTVSAPQTAAAFLSYVDAGYYKNSSFYRVLSDDNQPSNASKANLIQGGTATTEFFICIGDQPGFDYGGENNPDRQGYAAFGKVVKGMDIANRIYNRPSYEQSFDPPVTIINIVRL